VGINRYNRTFALLWNNLCESIHVCCQIVAGGYYGLIFAICAILFIPILFLKELDSSSIPQRSFNEHRMDLWGTLQNLTTLYLLIFVFGANTFSQLQSIASIYLQYYVIKLTNFQSGIGRTHSFVSFFGVTLSDRCIVQIQLLRSLRWYLQSGFSRLS
jgi:hypothetical protein